MRAMHTGRAFHLFCLRRYHHLREGKLQPQGTYPPNAREIAARRRMGLYSIYFTIALFLSWPAFFAVSVDDEYVSSMLHDFPTFYLFCLVS